MSGLVVDPEFQRQGIGREAVRLILEELKGEKLSNLSRIQRILPQSSSIVLLVLF